MAFVPDRRPLSPAWLHDFAATDKYAVILEHPLYMSLASLLLGTAASHLFMNWMPQDEVKISVVALDGSKVGLSYACAAECPLQYCQCMHTCARGFVVDQSLCLHGHQLGAAIPE